MLPLLHLVRSIQTFTHQLALGRLLPPIRGTFHGHSVAQYNAADLYGELTKLSPTYSISSVGIKSPVYVRRPLMRYVRGWTYTRCHESPK